ncbi:dienelactone hydrolase family protein [Propionivibrio sp.]|uniref:dienelactone hydrolase family protein n=1 Tax=Propionivibrio sp. TaxID=2212460 RepID=UPI0039E63221
MRHLLRALLLFIAWIGGVGAVTPVALEIPPAGLSSSPAPLKAYLFRPAGEGPFPAVVMLHGCGGAYARSGALNERHLMWGRFLADHGYAALMLDSFTSRGIKEICTIKFKERSLKASDRVGDAYAALAYLQGREEIRPDRVALLGWSNGAGVVLDAAARSPRPAAAFRAAVAFYPGCTARNQAADRFHPYAPLLLLIGESDDWTPAAPCRALAATVAARHEPMRIVTFPNAYHDFDNPALKGKHVRKEVPNGVNPGQGVTTAPDPAAREEAKVRVLQHFDEYLK